MKINRNYKSKDPVRPSGTWQTVTGEAADALSENQYHDDKEELSNLKKQYDLYQESEREVRKFEEERLETEQKIMQRIRELREKATETDENYELDEMEAMIQHNKKMWEEEWEERNKQKKILLGKIEDKEALCRKYEAERGKQEWD